MTYENLLVIPESRPGKMIQTFLETNQIPFIEEEYADKELPKHVLDGIKRGLEDAVAGRAITFDEFKKDYL